MYLLIFYSYLVESLLGLARYYLTLSSLIMYYYFCFHKKREVFFVPYVWDMIVGTLTTTTMEWSRNKIQVFPLNNEEVMNPLPQQTSDQSETVAHENTPDVV